MKKILILFAVFLLLTGCTMNQSNNSNTGGVKLSSAEAADSAETGTVDTTGPGIAKASGNKTADGSGIEGNSSNSDSVNSSKASTDPKQKTNRPPAKNSGPKAAVWTLTVKDTVDVKVEDLKIKYTLTLRATKRGGTTDLGSYTGTASLKMKVDASVMSKAMVSVMGGAESELKADNVKIEIVGYDREKFDDFGYSDGQGPLSMISNADSMALGSFTMTGSGKLNLDSIAPHTNQARSGGDDGTGGMPYKISVDGDQVSVSIPMLNIPDSFHGMITGVPIK